MTATAPFSPAPPEWTEDALLDGRIRLSQPPDGYRVAVDPVLLAAFTMAKADERVLDAGTGTGAAALCLAARVPGVRVFGIEKNDAYADAASRSVAVNHLQSQVIVIRGDLLRPPPALAPCSFDRVMMNPPYLKAGATSAPPNPLKAAAHMEGEARLADWIGFAAVMLKSRGVLTLIHRADRIDEILALMRPRFGSCLLVPIWPRAGEPARRILIAAERDGRGPATLAPGLTLHGDDGRYTPEAECLLREGGALGD